MMGQRNRPCAAWALGAAAAGLTLLAWGAPAGPPGRQTLLDQPSEKVVAVAADAGWVDTGIDVAPGEVLLFRASGEVNLQRGNPEAACGPDGLDIVTVDQPVPDANLGALIGKVAQLVTSRPDEDSGREIRDEIFVLFLIGTERAVAAPFKGRLYLGVNENVHKDNAGELSVVVIRRPA
jgi:hypothetical protein